MLGLRPPDGTYRQVRLVTPFAGLEATWKSSKTYQGWPLLVWGLWTFERIWEHPQCKLKLAICVEEALAEALARLTSWLGWDLRITRAGQMVLARLM